MTSVQHICEISSWRDGCHNEVVRRRTQFAAVGFGVIPMSKKANTQKFRLKSRAGDDSEVVFVQADQQLVKLAQQYQQARRDGNDPLARFRSQLEQQRVHR